MPLALPVSSRSICTLCPLEAKTLAEPVAHNLTSLLTLPYSLLPLLPLHPSAAAPLHQGFDFRAGAAVEVADDAVFQATGRDGVAQRGLRGGQFGRRQRED